MPAPHCANDPSKLCHFNPDLLKLRFETDSQRMERIEQGVADVLQQAKKTNGRVTRLEMWRAWLTGGVVVAGTMASTALTLWGLLR